MAESESNVINQHLTRQDDSNSQFLFLPVGTEVSAKFKGAFCEAHVKKLAKSIKIKVALKDSPSTIVTVDELTVRAKKIEINQPCEIQRGKQVQKGQIVGIKDCSAYTVIFNDGDERVLKRTQLCPKSGRHFQDYETLDKLPLNHPDKHSKKKLKEMAKQQASSSTSNSIGNLRLRRSVSVSPLKGIGPSRSITRRIAAVMQLHFDDTRSVSAAGECPTTQTAISSASNSPGPSSLIKQSSTSTTHSRDSSNSSRTDQGMEENDVSIVLNDGIKKEDEISVNRITSNTVVPIEYQNSLFKKYSPGQAVLIHEFTKPEPNGRIQLGMVVSFDEFNNSSSTLQQGKSNQGFSGAEIAANQVPIRSFQNGRYYLTTYDRLNLFDPIESRKLTDFGSLGLKASFERANQYVLKGDLPASWKKKIVLPIIIAKQQPDNLSKIILDDVTGDNDNGSDCDCDTSEENEEDDDNRESADDKQQQDMKKSNLVAHYYKFQEESGNQLNNLVPRICGKDIDIYSFYNVVNKLGGHKRVTQEYKWETVLRKLKIKTMGDNLDSTNLKDTYLRYFEKFEAFMKNLGSSSLIMSASASTSSQRNTRIIRTIAAPVTNYNSNDDKTVNTSNSNIQELRKRKKNTKAVIDGNIRKSPSPSVSTRDSSPAISVKSSCGIFTEKISHSNTTSTSLIPQLKSSIESKKEYQHRKVSAPVLNSNNICKLHKKADKHYLQAVHSPPMVDNNSSHSFIPLSTTKGIKTASSQLLADQMFSGTKNTTTKDVNGEIKNEPSEVLNNLTITSSTIITNQKTIHTTSTSDIGQSAKRNLSNKISVINKEHLHQNLSGRTSETTVTKDTTDQIKSELPEVVETNTIAINNDTTGISTTTTKNGSYVKNDNDAVVEACETPVHSQSIIVGTLTTNANLHSIISAPLQKAPQPRGRKPNLNREDRVKSPSGSQAILEDVGYSNAHIFTRFYQGQNVHARHHLRFYDARVITVKQPSLTDIAKSLTDTFELSRITHQDSPSLEKLTLKNTSLELKDALRTLMNSTKIFVHYLGWNSRYDEWLMLHKIRVDERDERLSVNQLEHLIPTQLAPQLVAVALDWCNSSEGIPSLLSLPSAQSCEQRPRRLSATASRLSAQQQNGISPANSVFGQQQRNLSGVKLLDNNQNTDAQLSYRSPLNVFHTTHLKPTHSHSLNMTADAAASHTQLPLSKFTIPHRSSIPSTVLEENPTSSLTKSLHFTPNPFPICVRKESPICTVSLNQSPTHSTTIGTTIISPSTSINSNKPFAYHQQNQQQNAPIIYSPAPPLPPILHPQLIASSNNINSVTVAPYSVVIKPTCSAQPQHCLLPIGTTTSISAAPIVVQSIQQREQSRSDNDSPFQLPPPPAPPILTPNKEPKQESISEKSYTNQNHVTNITIERHFLQTEAFDQVEYTLFTGASKSEYFSVKIGDRILESTTIQAPIAISEPYFDDVRSPLPSHQCSASISPIKKRKGDLALSTIAGAMSPPTKISRQSMIKSPARGKTDQAVIETSDEEESSFESIHSESLHSVRQRVLHRLEAMNAFDNDDYLGLPNLDEMLARVDNDPDEQVRLIEQRMRELHSIYHEYKEKLAELERQHRRDLAARRRQCSIRVADADCAGTVAP